MNNPIQRPLFILLASNILLLSGGVVAAEPRLIDDFSQGLNPGWKAEEFQGKAKVGKLNIGENMALAAKFGISGVPTLLFFKGGEEVADDRIRGAVPNVKEQIAQKLEALA